MWRVWSRREWRAYWIYSWWNTDGMSDSLIWISFSEWIKIWNRIKQRNIIYFVGAAAAAQSAVPVALITKSIIRIPFHIISMRNKLVCEVWNVCCSAPVENMTGGRLYCIYFCGTSLHLVICLFAIDDWVCCGSFGWFDSQSMRLAVSEHEWTVTRMRIKRNNQNILM